MGTQYPYSIGATLAAEAFRSAAPTLENFDAEAAVRKRSLSKSHSAGTPIDQLEIRRGNKNGRMSTKGWGKGSWERPNSHNGTAFCSHSYQCKLVTSGSIMLKKKKKTPEAIHGDSLNLW